jgi:hypothetical protein
MTGLTDSPETLVFAGECGSALWVYDPEWPELVHPFASAINNELPIAPERTHLLLDSKPSWVPLKADPRTNSFRVMRRNRSWPGTSA